MSYAEHLSTLDQWKEWFKTFPPAPTGHLYVHLHPQRECCDGRSATGVPADMRDRAPKELAEMGVSDEEWRQVFVEDLQDALVVLNHCCWEFWLCLFSCGLTKCGGEKANRRAFYEAIERWEEQAKAAMKPHGIGLKIVNHGFFQRGTGAEGSHGGVLVRHAIAFALNPDAITELEQRPRNTGRAKNRDVIVPF